MDFTDRLLRVFYSSHLKLFLNYWAEKQSKCSSLLLWWFLSCISSALERTHCVIGMSHWDRYSCLWSYWMGTLESRVLFITPSVLLTERLGEGHSTHCVLEFFLLLCDDILSFPCSKWSLQDSLDTLNALKQLLKNKLLLPPVTSSSWELEMRIQGFLWLPRKFDIWNFITTLPSPKRNMCYLIM